VFGSLALTEGIPKVAELNYLTYNAEYAQASVLEHTGGEFILWTE
jgi:hypothetical protein